MASSAPDVPESSRAGGQEAEQEPESEQQRKWVALVSVAVLLGNDDERAKEIAVGTEVMVDLNDPPLPSYLQVLHPGVAPDPRRNDEPLYGYILAAADRSACILLQVVRGNRPQFLLCDTHRRTVTLLPPVSSGLDIRRNISIGLITDPHHHGHYVVAQLQPITSKDHPSKMIIVLVCYSTAESRWFTKQITPARRHDVRMRNPFSETGVLAHDGRLWWLALAYGEFFCDPCTPLVGSPELRFVPLPAACETMERHDVVFDPRIRTLIDQRRCVRPSEGKLRFVEIRGLSYDKHPDAPAASDLTVWMWTLDDPEGPDAWTFEYEVAFAEIWVNKTYTDAGLLPDEVPHVALVDPNNHYVVYFFQGSKLFGFDMREKNVVACKECLIDRDQLRFQSSRPIVDAWELPPPPPMLPGDHDSAAADDDVALAQSGLGMLCRRGAFCSICRLGICLSCCPDHKSRHHGDGPGTLMNICMTKDGPALEARDVKINNMGYNWQFIQRKLHTGQKYILLHEPQTDHRNKGKCFRCNGLVKTKSRYCCAKCKAIHKPNGENTDIINALLQCDFHQAAIRDKFCAVCKTAFASAHCADHEAHHHEQATAA